MKSFDTSINKRKSQIEKNTKP